MKTGDHVEADIGMGLRSYGVIVETYPHELNHGFIWVRFLNEKDPAPMFASDLRVISEMEVFKHKLAGNTIREQENGRPQ